MEQSERVRGQGSGAKQSLAVTLMLMDTESSEPRKDRFSLLLLLPGQKDALEPPGPFSLPKSAHFREGRQATQHHPELGCWGRAWVRTSVLGSKSGAPWSPAFLAPTS